MTTNNFGGFEKRRDPIIALREAIDELTKPVTSRHVQDGTILTRTASPLIDQLQRAITNSLGAGSGAGKLARERTPLDVSAFTLYEAIDGRVKAWCVDAGLTVDRQTPGALLRRWFPTWTSKVLEDAALDRHTSIIAGWVTQISDMLEPPVRQELTAKCPICGAMWTTVGKGEEQESVRALWAVWRTDPQNSFGMCRSCDKVWPGISGMRSLRIAIDDDELAKETA